MFLECSWPCEARCYKAMDMVCGKFKDEKIRDQCLKNGKKACNPKYGLVSTCY